MKKTILLLSCIVSGMSFAYPDSNYWTERSIIVSQKIEGQKGNYCLGYDTNIDGDDVLIMEKCGVKKSQLWEFIPYGGDSGPYYYFYLKNRYNNKLLGRLGALVPQFITITEDNNRSYDVTNPDAARLNIYDIDVSNPNEIGDSLQLESTVLKNIELLFTSAMDIDSRSKFCLFTHLDSFNDKTHSAPVLGTRILKDTLKFCSKYNLTTVDRIDYDFSDSGFGLEK